MNPINQAIILMLEQARERKAQEFRNRVTHQKQQAGIDMESSIRDIKEYVDGNYDQLAEACQEYLDNHSTHKDLIKQEQEIRDSFNLVIEELKL